MQKKKINLTEPQDKGGTIVRSGQDMEEKNGQADERWRRRSQTTTTTDLAKSVHFIRGGSVRSMMHVDLTINFLDSLMLVSN